MARNSCWSRAPATFGILRKLLLLSKFVKFSHHCGSIPRCFSLQRVLPGTAALASPSTTPTSSPSSLLRHRRRPFLISSEFSNSADSQRKFSRQPEISYADDKMNAAETSASEININIRSSSAAPSDKIACNPPQKSISVMTLNCWGIPYVAKHRKERFEALTEALIAGSWDIVVLQEVWSENDFKKMVTDVEAVYPSSYYFYSGVLGSGVCVFTKGQIVATLMHRYSLNGYAHKIQHGDWFGGKVCGLAKIVYKGFLINLYATHIHASYHEQHDEYKPHRIVQAFELSQFIRFTSSPSTLSLAEGVDNAATQRTGSEKNSSIDWLHPITIVAGDFNMEASDLGCELIRKLAGLHDTWDSYKRHSVISKDTSNIHAETSECYDNFYTLQSTRDKLGQNSGKRIDYVLFGQPAGFETPYQIRCTHAAASLNKIPNSPLCYSDHKGYVAELEVWPRVSLMPANPNSIAGGGLSNSLMPFDFSTNKKPSQILPIESCPNISYGQDDPRRGSVAATTRSISHDASGLNDELIERAIAVVEDGFRKVRRNSTFFAVCGLLVFAAFIGTFVTSAVTDVQLGLQIAFAVGRVVLISTLLACTWIVIVMARIERNALRATRNTMMLMQGNMNPDTKSIDDDSILAGLLPPSVTSSDGEMSIRNGGLRSSGSRSFSTSRLPLFRNNTGMTTTTIGGPKRKLHRHRSSGGDAVKV